MIPTEPIGSIPRPTALLEAIGDGDGTDPAQEPLDEEAIRDTFDRFPGHAREELLGDLVNEHEGEIRRCLARGGIA